VTKFSMQLFNFVIIKVKLFIKFLIIEILAMKLFTRKSTNHYVSITDLIAMKIFFDLLSLIIITFLIIELLAGHEVSHEIRA
jgi:hypothetical protein